MAITTTSSLPAPVQQSFNYKLLSVPYPNLIHIQAAMKEKMPRNGGRYMRFRRYNPLSVAPVPLGNSGITPAAQVLSAVDIDAKIDWYGTFVILNEQVVLQNQDPTLNEAAARLGQSMRQTEDQLVRDMLASTASFINAVGGNNGDTPTEISDTDVSDVISTLVGNNAHMILDNIQGENRYGTQPIRQSFIAMSHSDVISDLDNQLTGFVSKYNYPNQQPTLDSEWGSFRNVRFLVSSVGSVTANASQLGANVYNIFVAAREAYGIVYQDGASAQFIYRDPLYDGPLALNATVGWKMAQVPRLLNDLWLLNLRVTITT